MVNLRKGENRKGWLTRAGSPREAMTEGVARVVEDFMARHLPRSIWPGHVGGFAAGDDARVDFLRVLADLRALGRRNLGGRPVEDTMREVIGTIHGEGMRTFACYRLAETLAEFGRFDLDNPLLKTLPEAVRMRMAKACDASAMWDPETRELRAYPNNYWMVLARAEQARRRLGLESPHGEALRELAARRARDLLLENPRGFLDDDPAGAGRYDIYAADSLLFAEPLAMEGWADEWRDLLAVQIDLLRRVMLPGGVAYGWGRSTGPFSRVLTVELAASGLAHGVGSRDFLRAALAAAWRGLAGEFEEGLASLHVGRGQDRYRGPARRVQATFDLLGKLSFAARQIEAGAIDASAPVQDPAGEAADDWVAFDDRGHGVWGWRGEGWAFQLPVVAVRGPVYAPWPACADACAVAADSRLFSGVPRVILAGRDHSIAGRITMVEKRPRGLTLESSGAWRGDDGSEPELVVRRRVEFAVHDGWLQVREHCDFDQVPESFSVGFAEGERPWEIEVSSAGAWLTRTDVSGIAEYRGFWGAPQAWIEIHVLPSTREVRVDYRMRPRS
jgi:hypothetical protein